MIYRFTVDENFPDEIAQNFLWAYRKANDKLVFSFHHPPQELLNRYKIVEDGGYSWRDISRITWNDGGEEKWIYADNLASELIRKSLITESHRKGLKFCPETKSHYFADGSVDRNRLSVILPDGKKNRPLKVVGERKYYIPQNKSEYYKYHLAPTFFVKKNLFQEFAVIFRIKIYLTDLTGNVLLNRKRNSRRKRLCKNWWNDDWFKRVLLIAQFLSNGEQIVIGDLPKEQIILDIVPISFNASGGIDENKLDKKSYERDETARNEDDESE